MVEVFNGILLGLSLLMAAPILVFCGECLLALGTRRRKPELEGPRPRVTVLIPAHNEEQVIAHTLQTLLPSLSEHDSVLVVADNCSDSTACIARAHGAQVVERHDPVHRGKGYALDFGVRTLASDPPDVLLILDADCEADPQLVEILGLRAHELQRPVQSLNLSEHQQNAGAVQTVATLAFRFKNLIRPLGLSRLGVPCHLTGTGMAFPWELISRADLANGHLVEDMQLGIDLTISGQAPVFCPETGVRSRFPQHDHAFQTQRTRWEHGHLQTLVTQGPRLLTAALRTRRLSLCLMAVDLCIPPLSLLVLAWMLATSGAVAAWALGAAPLPALVLLAAGAFFGLTIILGWGVFCRDAVPLKALLSLPGYLARKLPIYTSLLCGRLQTEWVRTARDPVSPATSVPPETAKNSPTGTLTPSR